MKKLVQYYRFLFMLYLSLGVFVLTDAQVHTGNYTIGGTKPNYESVQAAVDTLVSQGLAGDGHVIFNIRDGNYLGKIYIDPIANTDENNTITFQSENTDSSKVVIFYTTTSSSDNYVLTLNGCSYINFKQVTLMNTSTSSYGRVVVFDETAEHNQIVNCILLGPNTTSYSSSFALVYAYKDLITGAVIENCFLSQGSYAFYLDGNGTISTGLSIRNNQISSYRGAYFENMDNITIDGNVLLSSAYDGIELHNCNQEIVITNNKITADYSSTHNALYLNNCDGNPVFKGLIANNVLVNSGSTYSNIKGLKILDSDYQQIYNNTIKVENGSDNSYALSLESSSNADVKNNLLMNAALGYAVNYVSAADLSSDYNNFYTGGNFVAYAEGDPYKDLLAFQDFGQDANSTSYYPSFAAMDELIPQTNWINGTATTATQSLVTTDINGNVRDGALPDVGAYEFTPANTTVYSGVLTVGTGGDFGSISEAIDSLVKLGIDGALTLNLTNSSYNEQFLLHEIPGASATKTITFQSASGDSSQVNLIYNSTSADDNYVLRMQGADYIIFSKLTFSNSGMTYGRAINIQGNAHHNSFLNCAFTGSGTASSNDERLIFDATNALVDDLSIQNCRFNQGAKHVSISGIDATNDIYVENVNISNNIFERSYRNINLRYATGFTVHGNYMHDFTYAGIGVYRCMTPYTISANRIYSTVCDDQAMYLEESTGANGATIKNNFISIDHGFSVFGIYVKNSQFQNIYHNSVVVSGGHSDSRAIYVTGGGNIDLKNNIAAAFGSGYAFYKESSTVSLTTDYNNFYAEGTYLCYWDDVSYSKLSDYQLVSLQDANSYNINPGFFTDTDLHTNSYWLDGAGTYLPQVTVDIDEDDRENPPCIGADEYESTLVPLYGIKTIGDGGDYGSVSEAVAQLATNGMSGSVTFNIFSGNYNEQINIPQIFKINATDSIVFQSENGIADDVNINFESTTTEDNYVLKLSGTDDITFKNISFEAGNSSNSRVLVFTGNIDGVTIDSCKFQGRASSSYADADAVIYAKDNSPVINNLLIQHCTINDGAFGVYIQGNGNAYSDSIFIINNEINSYYHAVYLRYAQGPRVNHNVISFNYNNGSAIKIENCEPSSNNQIQILANKITSDVPTYYGAIYLNNDDAVGIKPTQCANNVIQTSSPGNSYSIGIYVNSSDYVNLYHNSVNVSGNAISDYALYTASSNNLDIKNNILAIGGGIADPAEGYGYAMYINGGTEIVSDYNNLYTPGKYLAYWQGSYCFNLDQLCIESGNEANSVSVFPAYFTANNLHTLSYWLNDKATPLTSVNADFDGNLRDVNHPDLGAFEFNTAQMPLDAGTYTVGTGGDFETLDSAFAALQILGINTSTTLNILDGEYTNVNFLLKDIPGTSSADTVIIQSQTKSAADVVLSYQQTANKNHLFYLNGSDYLTFKNLTFMPGGTSYSRIFYITGNSKHINFLHNVFNGINTNGVNAELATIYVPTDNVIDYLYFFGNTFKYNSYALAICGYPSYTNQQIMVDSNIFINQVKQLYYYELSNAQITRNIFSQWQSSAVHLENCTKIIKITENQIVSDYAGAYGLYFYDSDASGVSPALVANNYIKTMGYYSIYTYYSDYYNIYNNTAHHNGDNSGSALFVNYGSNINVTNNILYSSNNGYAYYSNNGTNIIESDYNDIIAEGSRYAYWGANVDTLSDLVAVSGMDEHSLEVTPVFFAENDPHLISFDVMQRGTPLDDVTIDIDGELRDPNTPDIGADEIYARPPIAESYTVCQGDAIPTLSANGLNINWYADAALSDLLISANEYNPGVTEPGEYIYYVTQTIGDDESDPTLVSLTINAAPKIDAVVTNINCEGNDFGSINISIDSESGPFFYNWSNGSISEDLSSLMPGWYNVTVKDIIGCSATDSFQITAPDTIHLTMITNDADCGDNNGSATIYADGGIEPYDYRWTTGDTLAVADSLASGIYVVTVSDANGCSESAIATINDLGGSLINVDAVSDVSCFGGTDGAIAVSISGGVMPYEVAWSNGQTVEDINNLPAGPYEISVTDADGCEAIKSIDVSQPEPIIIGLGVFDAQCGQSNGSAVTNVTGGVAPYQYLWSNDATDSEIDGLDLGVYHVEVTDDNGCVVHKSFAISEADAPVVYVDSVLEGTCGNQDGAIYITAYGGSGGAYSYLWNNYSTNEDLIGVNPGEYSVTVTDTLGCAGIALAEIAADKPSTPSICLVTVDGETSHNEIVWEKSDETDIEYFNIYRESTQANVYQWIGSHPYEEESIFVDENSDAQQRAYRYKISAVNNCGVESDLSDFHKTMHLTINIGANHSINLIWDHYEGFEVSTYYIYRYTQQNGFEKYDSIASSYTSYTDQTPNFDSVAYFIEILHPTGCTTAKASNRNSARSNVRTEFSGGSPTTYNVTFNVSSSGSPLENAVVDVGGTVKNTDSNGVAVFGGFIADETINYTVSKTDYQDYSGSIANINSDVTEAVNLIYVSITETNQKLIIYPNPNTGKFMISGLNGLGLNKLEIYNLSGEQLKTNYSLHEKNLEVDCTQFSPGIYLVKMYIAADVLHAKIIIE